MRLLKKITALFTSLAVAGASLLCVAPVFSVDIPVISATAEQARDAFNVGADMGLAVGLSGNYAAMPVVAAQMALCYAYGWLEGASSAGSGSCRYFSGVCYDAGGDLYAGSGYVNGSASAIRFSVKNSSGNTITSEMVLSDASQLQYCRLYPGHYEGVSGGSGTWCYTLSTSSSYWWTAPFSCTYEGDPFSGGVFVGSAADLTNSARVNHSGNKAWALFYSGGYNLSGQGVETSGDFERDFEDLQQDLKMQYPDVPDEYYIILTPVEDPTEDLTETTTDECGCTHIISVEPTINVEVNVEPTIYVENNLPSEWLETLPFESVENPLEELPTLEVENFTDVLQAPEGVFPESSGFWWKNFELWIKENDKVWKYFLGLFTIGVVGFILRGLG